MALTQIEQGMLKDGILTADTAGRAKVADSFVNSAKIADASVTKAKMGYAGAILQFAYGEEKSRLSGTTNNFLTVVSGVGYTPTNLSTKSLIQGQVSLQPNTGNEVCLRLYVSTNGGSTWTSIGESTATTNLAGVSVGYASNAYGWNQFTMPFTYLHIHGTTSALQYRVSATPQDGGGTTFYVNGSATTSGSDSAAGISTLSVMEISG